MKNKEKELKVDVIGGMGPLTKEDEKVISEYLQASKAKKGKNKTRLSSRSSLPKTKKEKA